MRESDQSLPSMIEEHGWAVISVSEEAGQPDFAYSVGLYQAFKHPEVIVFGLPMAVLQQIVNVIGRHVRAGEPYKDGGFADDVLEGYRCAFRAVSPRALSRYMGRGVEFYGGSFPALHCVWPDREGRFPWDAGTEAEYRRLQPMLSEGPEPFTFTRP